MIATQLLKGTHTDAIAYFDPTEGLTGCLTVPLAPPPSVIEEL